MCVFCVQRMPIVAAGAPVRRGVGGPGGGRGRLCRVILPFRPSADWTRPTHTIDCNLCDSESTSLNLIQNTPMKTPGGSQTMRHIVTTRELFKTFMSGSSRCGAAGTNLTRNPEVAGSIPGLAQWVQDLVWLWWRWAAVVPIGPLT